MAALHPHDTFSFTSTPFNQTLSPFCFMSIPRFARNKGGTQTHLRSASSVRFDRQAFFSVNSNCIKTSQPITFFSPSITSLPSSPTTISGSLKICCAEND